MLVINIPDTELFDEKTDRFITIKKQSVKLEHSLISISRWESKWCKPFFVDKDKSVEELLDYIRCMIMNPVKDIEVISAFGNKEIEQVVNYINSPMTATTVTFYENPRGKREVITSELIYYWMIAANIPIECEKWHINRLFALIKICGVKNQPNNKIGKAKSAKIQSSLNAKRRAKLHSKG